MLRMKSLAGIYVGYERWTDEPRVITRAFFKELAEPWRAGTGWRLRVGHRAVQVGRCRRSTEGDMDALKVLGGRPLPSFRPEEIGGWNGQGVRLEPETPDPAA